MHPIEGQPEDFSGNLETGNGILGVSKSICII